MPLPEQRHQVGIPLDATGHEKQDVIVRMPAVVDLAFAAVGHLQGTHLANGSHRLEDGPPCPIAIEVRQRLSLALQDELELVTQAVGGGQGQEPHLAALRLVESHRSLQLDPPALADLGRTDRAGPDGTAGLEALVTGRLVLPGADNLNLPAFGPETEAFSRP